MSFVTLLQQRAAPGDYTESTTSELLGGYATETDLSPETYSQASLQPLASGPAISAPDSKSPATTSARRQAE